MKHKIIAIIPARSDSSRLPAKHLRSVRGKPMLFYIVDRLQSIPMLNNIVLASTDRAVDNELCKVANNLGCDIYRGSLNNVIGRFASAVNKHNATIAIKANGDNPLQAPEVIENGLSQLLNGNYDLVTGKNAYTGLPVGLGAEVVTSQTVEWLDKHTPLEMREDVTRYVFECKTEVNWKAIEVPAQWSMPAGSITVDTPHDFDYLTRVVNRLPELEPRQWTIEMILKAMEE